MNEDIQFFIRPPYHWNPLSYELHARLKHESQGINRYSYPTQQIVWKTEDNQDGMAIERPPLLLLNQKSCQILMDQLWKAGIRPVEGHGSAGSFASCCPKPLAWT